jgi:adenylate cyclase
MKGVEALSASGTLKIGENDAEIPNPLALARFTEASSESKLLEWVPGIPDARETEKLQGPSDVNGSFIAPMQRFADVGQNFGFFAAHPDPDGVFRKQPLFFRHRPPEPEMDGARCTACNRRMLTPEKLAALGDAGVCSVPCRQACPECFIHAFYVPSLALSAVRQRMATTPVLLRDTDYPYMQAIRAVALLDSEPTPADHKPKVIPTDNSGNLQLNYYGHWRTDGKPLFPMLSVADIVANSFDKSVVKGKTVIFAVTALGTYDQRSTPYDPFVPGVVIHATAIQNMVQGDFLQRPWRVVLYELIFMLVVGLFLGLVLPRLSVPVGLALFMVLLGAYWLVDADYLFVQGYWIHLVFPYVQLLGTLILIQAHGYLTVGREKAAMRKAFGACLDPGLVDEIATHPDSLKKLKGDEREATCMFSDIRGFTTLSENLTPEELTIFLNDYFTPQAAAIMQHKGYLDKYIGDAIMALFGAPQAFADHAASACYAALDMMEQLRAFKKWVVADPKWAAFCQRLLGKQMDPAAFDIGIGLNSGLMRVGYMGSSQRTNYSALGDAVNLASRLEGQTKEYGVHVIISESTWRAAQGKVQARLLDSIRVKGKKEPVRIYELVGRGDPSPATASFIKTFETGIRLFQQRQFQEAIPHFAQALREKPLTPEQEEDLRRKGKPRDLISTEYLARCEMYLGTPPPPDWDGVVTKTTK